MKIESIIRRRNGTRVTMGGKEYNFQPDPEFNGAHTAEVSDNDHIQKFLRVTEGFRIPGHQDVETNSEAANKDHQTQTTNENTVAPSGGNDPASGDDGAGDQSAPGDGDGDGAQAPQGDGETESEQTSDPDAASGDQGDGDGQVDERERLAQQFEERFGKRPRGNWGTKRIREELEGAGA